VRNIQDAGLLMEVYGLP